MSIGTLWTQFERVEREFIARRLQFRVMNGANFLFVLLAVVIVIGGAAVVFVPSRYGLWGLPTAALASGLLIILHGNVVAGLLLAAIFAVLPMATWHRLRQTNFPWYELTVKKSDSKSTLKPTAGPISTASFDYWVLVAGLFCLLISITLGLVFWRGTGITDLVGKISPDLNSLFSSLAIWSILGVLVIAGISAALALGPHSADEMHAEREHHQRATRRQQRERRHQDRQSKRGPIGEDI